MDDKELTLAGGYRGLGKGEGVLACADELAALIKKGGKRWGITKVFLSSD